MSSRRWPFPAYALPHLLNRDSGEPAFAQVLVIGAGSGNDVSRALEWQAQRVDAVEIDPVIYRLGQRDHPDQPYADRRTFVHLDDGRNYLRSTNKQYDLIVYALVDSLVLHSSYSNIRLESYLFTNEAFADIKKRLTPGGMFVMYNYFRQGWIVARLHAMLEQTFGAGNPVVFNLPARSVVKPDDVLFNEFTMMLAGDTGPLQGRVRQDPALLAAGRARRATCSRRTGSRCSTSPPGRTGNPRRSPRARAKRRPKVAPIQPDQGRSAGRGASAAERRVAVSVSARADDSGAEPAGHARDGRRRRALPGAVPATLRVAAAAAGRAGDRGRFLAQMFFLGAGFMLIETKAVVQMALLFGSTWTVNSIVFCAVLSMILVANLFVLVVRPTSRRTVLCGALSLAGRQRARAARCVPRDVARMADRRIVPAGVHARHVRRRDFRDLVQTRRRSGSSVRSERRGRDGRRPVRVQLDAARLSVRRARRARVLRALGDQCETAAGIFSTCPGLILSGSDS